LNDGLAASPKRSAAYLEKNMKIGWLVYDDEYDTKPEFWTTEPESRRGRIVQIVYAIIEGG
jgi:hypothetical protein